MKPSFWLTIYMYKQHILVGASRKSPCPVIIIIIIIIIIIKNQPKS